jgi:hypothetical protein
MHPDKYKVVPQCRVCGKRYVYVDKRGRFTKPGDGVRQPVFRVDGWMNRRTSMNRAMGCMCSGYRWPGNMTGAMHRRGSLRCWYRSNGDQRAFGDFDYYVDPEIERMENEGNQTVLCV